MFPSASMNERLQHSVVMFLIQEFLLNFIVVQVRVKRCLKFRFICTMTERRPSLMIVNIMNDF